MNRSLAIALLLLFASSACARQTNAPSPFVVGRDGETFEQEIALRRAAYGLEGWRLSLEERVRALCPGARSPKYASDWAETRGELRGSLVQVAACLREGALRGETLTLVATSTGDDDVAISHAASIGDALTSLGVDPSRVRIDLRDRALGDTTRARACTVELRMTASPDAHATK